MLKDILFIPGKPGLFRLFSRGPNFSIVESLIDKKRIPAHAKDKLGMLSDAFVHTIESEHETSVFEVFQSIKEKENGKTVPIDVLDGNYDELRTYFAEVLPNFDRKRVYPNDILRILKWYNLLIEKGIADFSEKEAEEANEKEK